MIYQRIFYSCLLGQMVFFSYCFPAQENTKPQNATDQVQTQENPELKNSVVAGEQWLKLIDDVQYPQSWDTASLTFRLTIPKNQWIGMMDSIRKPLGSKISRQLIDQRTSKDPVGLPKGDYMVLLFQTSFSRKPQAKELITEVLESDGQWRVLTYQAQ